MLKKEIKGIVKNPVYYIVMILPFIITFIMSEGTKNYLLQRPEFTQKINVAKEIVLYSGQILDAKIQFAVSELNFMLLMASILIGLSVFEERRLHIWDRIVDKRKFVSVKFFAHYVFSVVMIVFNLILFAVIFDMQTPFKSILILLSMPIVSMLFGILIGLIVQNRAMLSNTILMIVMFMGFFGGALSLTSVLSNTKFMNVLMYISPLTLANKLIYKNLIHVTMGRELFIWIVFILGFAGLFIAFIERRIKNGTVI
ncbi:ABC transporter permease [Treponema sp. OMZ 787]|uniref:ABC transporter permease n=1 Tax=Treponema sp. OMZ 787 TaxID=2563669 RepID=UPI0020A47CC8|nr:ABC transporter permease [Treponema sp. OMZ 787]UTC63153.1 ABC transporter permease [Treponema sp. OMZ 787]